MSDLLTGTAAGVPWVARPPHGGARPDAPAVVAWHLLDSPRTEAAFAAAVPLHGLDAWRVYFGLPLSGARLPEGGYPELRRRVMLDPVLNVNMPVAAGAVEEFPAAWAAVRGQLGIDAGPIGVMGGSMGALAAQLAVAEGGADVRAAVLINPVVRLRDTIDGLSVVYGMSYPWPPAAATFAERADFVARAGELADAAVLVITGEKDFEDAIIRPADTYVAELRRLGVTVDRQVIPGMGHAIAEEPGVEPAPQTPHAAQVDRLAATWFARYLT
jgi:pimeloyl-ACP methyl ester carboxylesterase